MELTRSDHDQLEEDEHRAHHLAVVQLAHILQLVTQQKLEHEQQAWENILISIWILYCIIFIICTYDKQTPERS